MKAEVSAAVSAVSVSAAEAKREKITSTLNKTFLKQKYKAQNRLFPFHLVKKLPGMKYHLTYGYYFVLICFHLQQILFPLTG